MNPHRQMRKQLIWKNLSFKKFLKILDLYPSWLSFLENYFFGKCQFLIDKPQNQFLAYSFLQGYAH